MNRFKNNINILAWTIIFVLGIYICIRGFSMIAWGSIENPFPHILSEVADAIGEKVMETYVPNITASVVRGKKQGFLSGLFEYVLSAFPVYRYYKNEIGYETAVESAYTYEMIVSAEATDETYVDAKGNMVSSDSVAASGSQKNIAGQGSSSNAGAEQAESSGKGQNNKETAGSNEAGDEHGNNAAATIATGVEYSMDMLNSFDFLTSRFFTVESGTSAGGDLLNASALLAKDTTLKKNNSVPQILIFHTHSQEGFADSVSGDPNTTVVGVGACLADILSNQYGYNVIHHKTVYDLINGKLDRSYAYTLAEPDIRQILKNNPSIQVVLDIHRDGVSESNHLVTDINGKPTAKFMFVNGLSYTNKVGNIQYLFNPYISDNLAFSFKMQLMADKYYPGIARKILLKGYRYNLQLMPKMAVIEVGAQTNTLQEEKNAMEPLADILDKVLSGSQ